VLDELPKLIMEFQWFVDYLDFPVEYDKLQSFLQLDYLNHYFHLMDLMEDLNLDYKDLQLHQVIDIVDIQKMEL
jgi:hypothetical protein